MSREVRAHPRVTANITVHVRTSKGHELKAGQIRNISLGGVFIETAEPQPFGTDLDLEFSLPAPERRLIRCKGFVAWSTKSSPASSPDLPGMGVRLTDIGVQEMRSLAAFIDQELPKK